MPIKTKEFKVGEMHALCCEDDKLFRDSDGRVAIVFAQKELLQMIDWRMEKLLKCLDGIKFDKIPLKRRERARVKIITRIDEMKHFRRIITRSASLRTGKGYWNDSKNS